MASPITIIKNDSLLAEAQSIQGAARILAEELNTTNYKCYDPIERGYVYEIPYYFGNDEYRFSASVEVAAQRRKELEESGHKNARRVWLIPANPNEYDLEGAFSHYETLDWKRSYNYENGDIIFIYVSGTVKKVRYKVEVIEGLVDEDVVYDKEFWKDDEKYIQSKEWDWTRIRLVDGVETEDLSLAKLREHGLKGNIQGAMKLTGDLRDYIMGFFTQDLTKGYYPDEVPETLEEGTRKTVTVNLYERNPLARKKCIEHYGVQCQVCDIDFENVYGEVGRDFIHVHHIQPLNEIGQGYLVDPIKDLIPVCPNCHAMLHRKEDGINLSVQKLRERISTEVPLV
ncbi:5-methylcytosine-specific restriction protein A [Bacillus mesophilus]|uniref:HNH endonuclease n=1 Tax=Bacillus mesophilus TaxID=1808955 RepID=A0A6M0QAT4_9BACI|nr:HNH endonuclease [Bacillus mesophilus]MBM7662812.1 5-methylcytosine-specific restriction protein A [Bacillus mesophilus]NEY73403.1 HNH endonuclease [Bacillus mesophilus]